MKRSLPPIAVILLSASWTLASPGIDTDADGWLDTFPLTNDKIVPSGNSPYFPLEPGSFVVLGELRPAGSEFVLITVLHETETVDGIRTRVVEEREYRDGYLLEVSRNFFGTAEKTGDILYFGEDVDDYKDRRVAGHSGVWRAGRDGARAGLFLPGAPAAGMKYYLE
ncbi:MAG: hypothetical protein K8E66_02245, partial [Phycisphaerales bacterium]|nr:hypothetical protein [Phycisphaerales bacterium]